MSELERIKLAVKSLISLGIGKNQEEIGTMMGYKSKSSFSQVLNGKVPLPQGFVDKLCALDDRIEKSWILCEEGHVLKDYKQVSAIELDKLSEPDLEYLKKDALPLIPVEAMAGYGAGDFQVMEYETEKFIIPTFKGSDYLISVRGSSMYPKYNSGDIVACKHLPLDTFFQWNKVYVVDTEQGVLIKRICKAQKDDFVTMVSDNKSYDSFDLHKSAIRSLAIVMGVIRLE